MPDRKPSAASPRPFCCPGHEPAAFRDPIAVLEADHAQVLALCDVLDRLQRNPRHGADPAEVAAVHNYLQDHLSSHIADEEEDLFPLLRGTAAAGDDIDRILGLLHAEHETDRRLNHDLCGDLERLVGGRAFTDPARFLMTLTIFAETQRRHLAWENTVVLARARKHLKDADRVELGRRMAQRRGLVPPD